ncbi:hypothetical protein CDAR_379481 [Caerostris darwini]|uniref:Uncharacterized protein n=1 Tax=Caerostris darwini TaxID=1538125 RepID=A0AAV4VA88_9ARAC|nr:hypothetical protein CDAR_379481 [Caerostris darwini]
MRDKRASSLGHFISQLRKRVHGQRKKKALMAHREEERGGKKRGPLRQRKRPVTSMMRWLQTIAGNRVFWGHSGRTFKGLQRFSVDGPITAFNGKNVFTYGKVR